MRTISTSALALAALLGVVPSLAQAQMFNSIGGGNAPAGKTPAVPPPPALPGAAQGAQRATAAPATKLPTDMAPNDALFDAINRGDLAAARDAISRGADLHARNILGMTPLDLSVDLGRNDISFMLLSMRGGDDGRSRQQPVATAAKGTPKPARAPVAQAKAAPAPKPAQPQSPRLYAGDGGSPIPNAGFLGFDSGRR